MGRSLAALRPLLLLLAALAAPWLAAAAAQRKFVNPTPAASHCSTSVKFQGQSYKYSTCSPLENGASLAWSLNETTNTLKLHLEHEPEQPYGWVAWGVSPTGAMVKSSVLLVYSLPDGVHVDQYYLQGYDQKLVNPGGGLAVTDKAAEVVNSGNLYKLQATLQLNSSETKIKQVWGKGPGVTTVNGVVKPQPHIIGDNVFGSLDLTSGLLSVTSQHQNFKNTHGALNAVSWGLMIPFGVFFPRYVKAFTASAWYYMHMPWQLAGYIIGVIGFGYGCQLDYWRTQPHWTHRNLGISIFAFATLQITALVFRPNKDSGLRLYWNIYHHLSGWLVVLLGIINVFYGFHVLGTYGHWRTVYIVVLAVMGGAALLLEAVTWFLYFKRGGLTREQAEASADPITKASAGAGGAGNGN